MVHFNPSIEQQKHFIIIAKLTILVWGGVATMNGEIYMVKQLNYVWLTAGITE